MIESVEFPILTRENLRMGANYIFRIKLDNGEIMDAPAIPENRHYWEVREWYMKQPDPKPFIFNFAALPK